MSESTYRDTRNQAGPQSDGTSRVAKDIWDGIVDGLLFIPLYLPLAVPYAVLARRAGFSTFETVLWSTLIFACSAQLACLTAFVTSAGLPELMVITFMANIRHGFVGMAVTPYVHRMRRWVLPIFCFTIASSSAGLIPFRARQKGHAETYALATQICQWLQWVAFSLLAVWTGALIPASWVRVVNFAVPAAFLGLLCSMVKDTPRRGVVVALAAGCLALGLCLWISPHLSVILSAPAGAIVGLFVPEVEGRDEL